MEGDRMSRYAELWKTFTDGQERFSSYREEVWGFAGRFAAGLVNYLACPMDQIRFVPLSEGADLEKTYTMAGALNYDDDGYWTMGIQLTIRNPESDRPGVITLAPQAGFLFRFSVRKEKNRFQLRTPGGKHVEFDSEGDDDLVAYYEGMMADMKRVLSSDAGPRAKDKAVQRIGF
jgi:hypothetical protein